MTGGAGMRMQLALISIQLVIITLMILRLDPRGR